MAVRPGVIRAVLRVWALSALGACAREPIDVDCGEARSGDLVISEIRGPQSGTDGYGEWIELYNTAGAAVSLTGARVTITKLDGSSSSSFVIRAPSAEVPADGFAVLGQFPAGQEPPHVDIGYGDTYDGSLPRAAAIELSSCGEVVDRVIFRTLPLAGTFSFTGEVFPPDSTDNDDETAWCTDAAEDADTPQQGIRGTPGERNRTCT